MHPLGLLNNPLATPSQLLSTPSQSDGIPANFERSLLFAGSLLIQACGIPLRLPQTTIATAIILFQRFWLVGSMREFSIKAVLSASIYVSSKFTEQARPPRDILNVLLYILNKPSPCPISPKHKEEGGGMLEGKEGEGSEEANSFYVDEQTYQHHKNLLLRYEMQILRFCSFQIHVSLPYSLAINYLQVLDALPGQRAKSGGGKFKGDSGGDDGNGDDDSKNIKLVKSVFGYLTDALLSPSLLYLTHQPNALATAAIYLAARDVGVKLPDPSSAGNVVEEEEPHGWWEVFDVEREELGFLVVCLRATGEWVREECERNKGLWGEWIGRGFGEEGEGLEGVERELERRRRVESETDEGGSV